MADLKGVEPDPLPLGRLTDRSTVKHALQNTQNDCNEGKCKWSYGPSCPVDFPLNVFIHCHHWLSRCFIAKFHYTDMDTDTDFFAAKLRWVRAGLFRRKKVRVRVVEFSF